MFLMDEITEPAPGETPAEPLRDPWDEVYERLRSQHPEATHGTLFCLHKIQLDPDATLKDFRDEARLRDIGVSGRSFHAAKVLLGRAAPAKHRKRNATPPEPTPAPVRRKPTRTRTAAATPDSLEATVLAAVQQIQAEATSEAKRMRGAILEAIRVLEAAIAD